MLNKSFDRKFSEEQFLTLEFFHKNANSAKYLRKTVFWELQTTFLKKAAGGYCGIFSLFFRPPFYTTFSNQTFTHTVCTFFFEISLICLGYNSDRMLLSRKLIYTRKNNGTVGRLTPLRKIL